MYTHLKYLLISLTSLLLASCSSNDVDMRNNSTAHVSLCVEIPHSTVSRGADGSYYSDGQKATVLDYAIYDANNNLLLNSTTTLSSLTASINVDLAIGKEYNLVFWAHAPGAPYTFDAASATVTLSTDAGKLTCNDDTRDAFFKKYNLTVSETETSHTITLRRPFAQLNFGLTDSPLITVEKTAIMVNSATKLNLLTGDASDVQKLTFAANTTPASQGEVFPNVKDATPTYFAMAYLLPEAGSATYDATLYAYESGLSEATVTRTFSNLTFKTNHRTNVYGKLLSSTQNFNIIVDPVYDSTDKETTTNNTESGTKEEVEGEDDNTVTEYYIYGGPAGWSVNEDYKFTYQGDGVYTLKLQTFNTYLASGSGIYITTKEAITDRNGNTNDWGVLPHNQSFYPDYELVDGKPILTAGKALTLLHRNEVYVETINTASNTTFQNVKLTFTIQEGTKEATVNNVTKDYSWATLVLEAEYEVNE